MGSLMRDFTIDGIQLAGHGKVSAFPLLTNVNWLLPVSERHHLSLQSSSGTALQLGANLQRVGRERFLSYTVTTGPPIGTNSDCTKQSASASRNSFLLEVMGEQPLTPCPIVARGFER